MTAYRKYLDIEFFEGEISEHHYPWHFHECYTVVMVSQGSILYNFRSSNITLYENEVLIIEPLEAHRNIILENTKYKAIFLPKEYFDFLPQTESELATQKVNCFFLIKILNNIAQELSAIPDKEEVKNTVKKIYYLFREYISINGNGSFVTKKTNHSVVEAIQKPDYNSSVSALAENAHLSKFHFQRKFKNKYGLTIGQLKQQQKAVEARFLLEKGEKSTDVAYRLGFFDQSHFIKYFKRMWAILPKEV